MLWRPKATRLLLATFVAMLSTTVLASPARADTSTPIRNYGTHKCIDVATENNIWVQEWSCNGQPQQQWTRQWVTSVTFWLISQKTGGCLGVRDTVAAGVQLASVPCGGPSTYWGVVYAQYNGLGLHEQLWNTAVDGLCLDLLDNNSTNGTPIQLWWCWPNDPPGNPEGNPAQLWLSS